jgi:foldase protein PrsA
MTRASFVSASMTALLAVVVLTACGGCGRGRDSVIVWVGTSSITRDALAHWMSALAPEHMVPDPPQYAACVAHQKALVSSPAAELKAECMREYQALKRHALDFLISSDWLIGEAADRGLTVSEQETKHRLDEKINSFANGGEAEFQESLKATAHTIADTEHEIEAELASSKLRQKLTSSEHQITYAQVASYYRRNIQRFLVPERRYLFIVENLKSEVIARRLMREVALGQKSLARTGIRESLPRPDFTKVSGVKRTIDKAIFAATPNVVAEPVKLNHVYLVFEVTRIAPGALRPLAQVQRAIAGKLSADRQRRALARFIEEWRTSWIARTNCRPGYVVEKCRQYHGPRMREEPLSFP